MIYAILADVAVFLFVVACCIYMPTRKALAAPFVDIWRWWRPVLMAFYLAACRLVTHRHRPPKHLPVARLTAIEADNARPVDALIADAWARAVVEDGSAPAGKLWHSEGQSWVGRFDPPSNFDDPGTTAAYGVSMAEATRGMARLTSAMYEEVGQGPVLPGKHHFDHGVCQQCQKHWRDHGPVKVADYRR